MVSTGKSLVLLCKYVHLLMQSSLLDLFVKSLCGILKRNKKGGKLLTTNLVARCHLGFGKLQPCIVWLISVVSVVAFIGKFCFHNN